jgi:hypothetical protein
MAMPPLFRWWLNRRWAYEVRADDLARIELTLGVAAIALAFLLP